MVPGREEACLCLWPDPGGRLEEGMTGGTKKDREGSMEGDRVIRL